jgi:hypothetical protein
MKLPKTARATAAVVAVAALMAAGCGDDDDEASNASSGSASGSAEAGSDGIGTADAADADVAAFCDAAVAVDAANLGLDAGETTPDDLEAALTTAQDEAPAEISTAVGVMATEARALLAEPPAEDGPPPIPSNEFFAASVDVGGYLSDNCDFETLEIGATNYRFSGIPESVPAGTTVLNFSNAGTEFHEVALMKVADGEERPLEELMALSDDEVEPLVTEKAFVLTPPGVSSYVTAELEPGRYVALCFVPVGATPEALQSGAALNEEDGHFMHGMVTEFTVS